MTTPLYESIRQQLLPSFPSPVSDPVHDGYFVFSMLRALDQVDSLKGQAPVLGAPRDPDFAAAVAERLPEQGKKLEAVIPELVKYTNGMIVWTHPQAQVNVVSCPSMASIVGAMLPAIYNPNLVSEESGRGFSEAEARATAMAADLVGYDPSLCGGLFTFGGTGTLLYGLKIGLEKCLPEVFNKGVRSDAVIFASQQGHYGSLNAAGWLGIGQENVIKVESHSDNSMKVDSLESAMREALQDGRRIAAVVATMATTDAFGIDDLQAIVALRDRLTKEFKLDYRPHVHADAVIGWAWSVFRGYDYDRNELGFRGRTLRAIAAIETKVRHLGLSDSLGIDFHKTGFVPYISSLFLLRNQDDFAHIVRERGEMPYLYHTGHYHPGMYTLETSRSGCGSMAALASMMLLGRRGLQSLLGHAIEMAETLREGIAARPELTIVNEDNFGPVTLFRAYPPGVNTFSVKQREFEDPSFEPQVQLHNELNRRIFERVQEEALEGRGVALGFTDLYRKSRGGVPINSLKSYVLSPHITSDRMRAVIDEVLKALKQVWGEMSQ
jgi:L-2,4-diaminobutyrate decarboxylase